MTNSIIVLGAGRIGRTIANELVKDYDVSIVDNAFPNLDLIHKDVLTNHEDLRDCDNLAGLISTHDMVVCALPSYLGYKAILATIEAGKDMVDVSYMEEDPMSLHKLAIEAGVAIIVDCGLAPGLTNLLVGRVLEEDKEIAYGSIYCGGMSLKKDAPYGYRLTWSPEDLLEAYLRKARYILNSRVASLPALSGIEEVNIPGVGMLEAFMTDGLRTLLKVKGIHSLLEKTLRWPGHAEAVRELIKDGKFLAEMKDKCSKGDDLVALHCELNENIFDMVVEPGDYMTAMQRSTGLTCTAFTKLLAECGSLPHGIITPEEVGKDKGLYEFILNNLHEHGMEMKEKYVR